jgi:glycerophosphoryl diester phosphodiesterase
MNTSKEQKTLIFAHRGVPAKAPENTLPSFQLALDAGADGIELDVILSKDKQPIVIHDFELGRTSSIQGVVQEMTLEEIKRADAGSWFGEEFSGVQIPTLQEVFNLVGNKLLINIELKMHLSDKSADLVEIVIGLVKQNNLENSVIYSSFNPHALSHVKRLDPNANIGLLSTGDWIGKLVNFFYGKLSLHPNAYHLSDNHVTAKYISNAHKKGIQVRSYTVNQIPQMKQFFDWKIDGIFTDDAFLALMVRDGEK